jgi:hypothetical protein
MTQAAIKSTGAAQALPTCAVEAERDGLDLWPPEISLPLDGLSPEEVDLTINALEFLCILIESYDMSYAEEAASGNDAREHHSVLPAH